MSWSALIFSASCIVLAILFWRPRPGAVSPGRVLAGVFVPALAVIACLGDAYTQERFGEIRLALRSVMVDARGDQPLRVGGDRATDDLVVSGVGGSTLTLSVGENGTRLHTIAAPTAAGSPLVGSVDLPGNPIQGARHRFLGAAPIAVGDAFCVLKCDRPDARWYLLSRERVLTPGVVRDGRVEAVANVPAPRVMPTRLVLRAVPEIAFWSPAQAIHPLRDFLPPADGARSNDADCDQRYYCVQSGDEIAPARGFLYQQGGILGGQWFLMPLDGVGGHAPGGLLSARRPVGGVAQLDLAPGASLTASVWEVRYIDAIDDGAVRGQLIERRTFSARPVGQAFQVRLETPDIQVIGGCARTGDVPPSRIITNVENVAGQALSLNALGGTLARSANGEVPIPSRSCVELRQAKFDLGEISEGRAANLILQRVAFPWMMLWVVLGWAVVSLAAQISGRRMETVPWIIVTLTQLLLGIRWLIALAGSAADPALDLPGLMQGCAIAYVAGPAAVLLSLRQGRRTLVVRSMLGVFVFSVVAAAVFWNGWPDMVTRLIVTGFAAFWVLQMMAAAAPGLFNRLLGAALRVATIGSERGWRAQSAWVWLICGAIAMRLVLGFLGLKERVGLSISAFYTPLLVIGFAQLLAQEKPPGERPASLFGLQLAPRTRDALVFAALWFAAAGTPVLVYDVGYSITLAPLAVFAAVYYAPRSRNPQAEPHWSRTASLLRALPSGFVALVCLGPLLLGPLTSCGLSAERIHAAAEATDDGPALDILSTQASFDQNSLRLALLAAPDRLASAGTREAENLRAWSIHLADYTGSLMGRGFMSSPTVSAILLPVQLNDNVSAIHLMSPFGRLGAMAFLLTLSAAAVGCARAQAAGRSAAGWPVLAGLISLWTLFGVAAYIVLANLQLLPFTGRNVYLLAASSGSDLIEGLTLLGIALWGLRERRA